MRNKIIAANWKMNLLHADAVRLVNGIKEKIGNELNGVDVVLAPPYTLLSTVSELIKNTHIQLCGQNVFWKQSGAYTGEISPEMLKDSSCNWVIIGHSERRNIMGEDDEIIRKKVNTALDSGLKVILCVGESLEQREGGLEEKIIKNQVEIALKDINNDRLENIVVAYEPVWAIGTGKNATPRQISEIHTMIKKWFSGHFEKNGENMSVLYGGSVSPDNIVEIINSENVDGALVGGASLKAESFSKIVLASGD